MQTIILPVSLSQRPTVAVPASVAAAFSRYTPAEFCFRLSVSAMTMDEMLVQAALCVAEGRTEAAKTLVGKAMHLASVGRFPRARALGGAKVWAPAVADFAAFLGASQGVAFREIHAR